MRHPCRDCCAQALGIPFEVSQIELVREPVQQVDRMKVRQRQRAAESPRGPSGRGGAGGAWQHCTHASKPLRIRGGPHTALHGHVLMQPTFMLPARLLLSTYICIRQQLQAQAHSTAPACLRSPCSLLCTLQVPESALNGHAFHTYQLVSPDGSVMFEFQHNVVGRTTYAEGTVDAALFLARQIEGKAPKTLYNMIDVLKAGAMR